MFVRIFLALLPIALLPAAACADTIDIVGDALNTSATLDDATYASQSTIPTLGLHSTQTATLAPLYPFTATDVFDFTNNFANTSLNFQFTHARGGDDGGYTQSDGQITFVPLTPLNYALSGNFTATDAGVPSLLSFSVSLLDNGLTTSPDLYFSAQADDSHNTSLTLTSQPGSSLTGTLLPGHSYALQYFATLRSDGADGDAGATASGYLNLDLSPTAVPLPGALPQGIACFAVLAGIARVRTRRRSPRNV